MRHFLAAGQCRHGEIAQVVAVAHAHVHQEIVGAGHVIQAQHFRQRHQVRVDGFHLWPRMPRQPHRHHGLQADADGGRGDLGVVTQQPPGLAQASHPLERGRGRHAHAFGQVLVRDPCILPQEAQDGEVRSVKVHAGPPFQK